MKKLILITSLAAIFTTSSALAKTEGNYFGVDLLRSSANQQYQHDGKVVTNYKKFDDSSYGIGTSYKYAFNFNKIFIAPGAFYEKLGIKSADQDKDTVSLNDRYGAKLDIGYDVTEKFAAYFTNGLSKTSYKVDWKSIGQKKSGSKADYFYGVGLGYKVSDNLVANLEYNRQSTVLDTPNLGGINQVKADLNVLKVGLAYNF